MVQKEVKKKTSVYAVVAVLSAIVLISMVYAFGSTPVSPSPQSPGTVSNTSPGPGATITQIAKSPSAPGMKNFVTMEELKNYLVNNTLSNGGVLGVDGAVPTAQSSPNAAHIYWERGTDEYSTTNIQVSGVDEADTAKTDGQYIYVSTSEDSGMIYSFVSQASNTIYVVNADPQNAKVESKINLDNDTVPIGLFISPDSSKLVVLANKNQMYYAQALTSTIMPYYNSQYTAIYVYDVSNKAEPVLSRNFTVSGSYFDSRMIGNDVYAVTTQSAFVYNDAVTLPAVYKNTNSYTASPTSIYYSDMNQSTSYSFTSFYGIDLSNDQQQTTNMTVLMSGASTMYVSPNNIYVTYPTWANSSEFTSIYRVKIDGLNLSFRAQGSVPGYTLNQYSMDEYNGYLRIATNADPNHMFGWFAATSSSKINNVYVLNQNLTVTGKLEGLAQGENLHAVRFIGDKCYLVTFIKTDPLFVIDLNQPTNPSVLGELTIPGYSDYLHPYDESHLIGVGKDAVGAVQGNFAWYQGLKLALFDVSNVNNPVQVANYVIGDRGTDSTVLNDPKAFLFDKSKDLLVIPVNLALVNQTYTQQYPSDVPAYGQMVWQGAYVFSVTANGNFTLRGTVTHLNSDSITSQGPNNIYDTQNQWITRSLYIGNTLYTVSNAEVKLNSLTDLSQTAEVILK